MMKCFLAFISTLLIHAPLLQAPYLCAASNIPDPGAPSPPSRHLSRHASWRLRWPDARALDSQSSPTTNGTQSVPTTVSSAESSAATSTTPSVTAETITTNTAGQPPAQTTDPTTANDIQTIHERRLSNIIGSLTRASDISAWLSTLGPDGKWPDTEVDYTSGCPAQRANWPAQEHWQRLSIMAGAWHGGLAGADQYVGSEDLRNAISLGMDFWFANDFTDPACLDSGGTPDCPCGTFGLWNLNWFSNIILIPELVGETCLILNDTLTDPQLNNCTHITGRAYGTFDHSINGVGFLTGANTLDVAKIGIDQGLFTVNASLITDAYRRVHDEVVIQDAVKADGIRPDGSFGQHGGILYNGNYGKDYTNDVLDLEIEAGGTQFAANSDSQNAFATLFDGDTWMVFRNVLTGVNHWDFSTLGRFISFPVIDNQATGSIKINLTEVGELGEQWESETLINFADSLSKNATSANAGKLEGNRMFYDNDYMVHRGHRYVTTVKMYSTRTQNSECTNNQNPFGFHLADGVVYTYLQGNEYEDISAAWDWDLIPGITVDYGATALTCANTRFTGIESFVGGASDGKIGIAVMRYTNPLTKALHWQKAWFFLEDDVQRVMVSDISSTSDASVLSVLDQRRHVGDVLVDGSAMETSSYTDAQSLWHGGVGYTFPESGGAFELSLQVGNKTGNWSAIGISTQPPPTVDLFAAWIEHKSLSDSLSYTVFPGTDADTFRQKSECLRLQTLQNDKDISAVFDETHNTAMVVFWDNGGGSARFVPSSRDAPITIKSNGNAAVIYNLQTGDVTLSDPSQSLSAVQITLSLEKGRKPPHWGKGRSKDLVFTLPTGGLAGSSISRNIQEPSS